MSSNLSPKKYIINNCRSLPIYECYLNSDWKSTQMANVLISRQMKAGNLCVGIFLVDLLCMGVKDTAYQFNLSLAEYNDFVERMNSVDENVKFKKVDYPLVHNIIYEGIAFADDCGLQPYKDFAITKFFLKEDDDSVELIDIPHGDEEDGLPVVFSSPH